MNIDDLKVPPHSIEAEQSVIGGCMIDNNAWDKVSGRLFESDFYQHRHRLIFRAFSALASDDKPFDIITLSEYLKSIDELDNVDGLAYLGQMAKDTPSAANISAYVEIVRDKALRRDAISFLSQSIDDLFNGDDKPITELIAATEKGIFDVHSRLLKNKRAMEHAKVVTKRVLTKIDEASKRDFDELPGLSTGLKDLDDLTDGLDGGDLVYVAGRPSMGKTTLALNIADDVSKGGAVAVFSLEMPSEQLIMRNMAGASQVSMSELRRGKVPENKWPFIGKFVQQVTERGLFIDDTGALSATDVRTRARQLTRDIEKDYPDGLSAIVIDYIQLMVGAGNDENARITAISSQLKAMAKELDVPVIVLSQLNRSLENRPNKRPIMADLRGSGAIEQDADMIMFVYRDVIYNEDTPEPNSAEIIIAKQRNGGLGTVRCVFDGPQFKFKAYSPDVYVPQ